MGLVVGAGFLVAFVTQLTSVVSPTRAMLAMVRVEWIDGDLVEHGTAEQFGETIEYSEPAAAKRSTHVVIADRVDGIGRLA